MASLLDELRAIPSATGGVALTWLGQSGFALSAGGITALVDPFLAPNPTRRYESALAADAVTGVNEVLAASKWSTCSWVQSTITGNLESTAEVVRAAEEEHRAVSVLVPPREVAFVVSTKDGR